MAFITDDFLLSTTAARRLYHTFAKDEPIIDYHNHLPPKDIAEDRQFKNIHEIWLKEITTNGVLCAAMEFQSA